MKRSDIEKLLPLVFRRTVRPGKPLFALLKTMESMHRPAEQALDEFHLQLDPRTAGDDFVPFLGCCVGLSWLRSSSGDRPVLPSGLGRLRELTAQAHRLAGLRGTEKGLVEFLRVALGSDGFRVADAGDFHLKIHVPDEVKSWRSLIDTILEHEKPAYASYELVFDKPQKPTPKRRPSRSSRGEESDGGIDEIL